jgi:hypothetical protein
MLHSRHNWVLFAPLKGCGLGIINLDEFSHGLPGYYRLGEMIIGRARLQLPKVVVKLKIGK